LSDSVIKTTSDKMHQKLTTTALQTSPKIIHTLKSEIGRLAEFNGTFSTISCLRNWYM